MENMINLTPSTNRYLQHFYLAQKNLNKLIEEERLLKKIRKSRQQATRDEQ
jgi:hypothetical protein